MGFEELCAQLARLETPASAEFVRKGTPDGGVECFCKLEDGREWGWQAKFFRESLGETQWKQIDRSVKTALKAHPRLVRYVVCVPRDRADSRRAGVTTEMQKWEQHVSTWECWAQERGMEVEFVWWGSSEMTSLLSQDRQAGRCRFWFGTAGQFSDEWFGKQLQRAITVAGPRYTPEIHVDVPIVEDFELFGRTEAAEAAVRDLAKNIRQTSAYSLSRLARDDTSGSIPELGQVVESVETVVKALYGMRCVAHRQWPVSEILPRIDDALDRLSECVTPLSRAADAFETRDEAEEVSNRGRHNPYREAVSEVHAVRNALGNVWATLERFEPVVNRDPLIVTGKAGSGKTHLLCDVATQRLAQGSPTVVLMGQQFTTTELPWIQARAQLDLTDLSLEQFVGALEAAAQAADARALFMIDAINEGEGQVIWPSHLADHLTHLRASPWIGVVLSVRSHFAEHVVPDLVRDTAHEVEHHGFADDPYAAVERLCEHYILDYPATPLLRHEFSNPLFLKTLCEGLHNRGERSIPVGSEGITTVFDRYLDAIDDTLAAKLDYDPHDRIVTRAVDAVASELAERGTRWLPKPRARELVDPLAPGKGYSLSLYRALVDTGLLMEIPGSSRNDEWSVFFGYEWFADHLIAKHLIARCGDAQELARTLAGDHTEGDATAWTLWNAPLEALSILFPELLGVELPEALAERGTSPRISRAFLGGLPWRDPTRIGSSCRELTVDLLDAAPHSGTVDVFDALMACAIVPQHPLGAAFLEEHLRRLEMPDRDAVWSQYLYLAYGSEGPLDRLLDWAEKHPERAVALDHDTASACAAVLAWCLTASHRFVRDRATKGLVAILTNKIPLTSELVQRFHDVDDPYVRERLMAAAYGVAMRSTDTQALAPLAECVYRLIFADGEPPAHILLRDYARGVIERALHLGADIAVDATLLEPPYRSEWPHIPDDSEMQVLDPPFEEDRAESNATRARGDIARSVMRWDFACYVIGTNSASASSRWLSVPINDAPWRSPQQRAENFMGSLDPDLQEAFSELWAHTRPVELFIPFVNSGVELEADEADESALAYTIREPYIDPELETLFLAALTDQQRTEYEDVKAARGADEPRLELDIIQRYVLWRAFDLGWTMERFDDLDRSISRSNSYSGRDTRKPERIGKKYQWIAYHEILAHISDHYQYWVRYDDAVPKNEYRGTWQLDVRDIDPSAVVVAATSRRGRLAASNRWWNHDVAISSVADVSNQQWLQDASDIPSRDQHLRYTRSDNDSTWIKLQGMDVWQSQVPAGYDRHEVDYREIWLYACGYLIDATEVEPFIDWSNAVDFSGRWMPEPPRAHSLFFGELGWSFASEALIGDYLGAQQPEPRRGGPRCPVPLRPAAFECSANGGEYDCSLAHSDEFYRPNPRLAETMNLQWTGHGADFVQPDGTLAAFDPSAHDTGRGALLVHEETLARFLDQTRSALVWAIIGEKRAIRPRDSDRPRADFLQLEGACVYQPGRLTGDLTTHLE